MHRSIALVGLVALAGCPTTTKTDSGDSGIATGTCTPPVGAPIIAEASVTCDTSNNVTYWARTTGWVQQGGAHNAYAIDSQNASPWSESHPLDTNLNRDECGERDELELTMATAIYGGPTGTDFYDPGFSSFFTCAEHYTKPVMSYAMEIYDEQGNYADCFAFGEEPDRLVAGEFSGAGAAPEMDLSACTPAAAR